jgi:hypothetical protein
MEVLDDGLFIETDGVFHNETRDESLKSNTTDVFPFQSGQIRECFFRREAEIKSDESISDISALINDKQIRVTVNIPSEDFQRGEIFTGEQGTYSYGVAFPFRDGEPFSTQD